MRIELQKLHREINATMIYVTHDQTEAMTLGTRIAVLSKGKLMQVDTPLQVYNHPANQFVAGFIGSPAMNFIKGVIERRNGYYFKPESAEWSISLGIGISDQVKSFIGKPILIGLRPENIVICENNADAGLPDCTLEVSAYENMGNEQLVYLSFAEQTLVVRRPPVEMIEVGKPKGIRFLVGTALYLNGISGELI